VLIHAIIDALLGASALGDIGSHFPPTDLAYKDISSMELLRQVVSILKEAGFGVVNIDSTIVAESPRMAEFIPAMRANIAETLGVKVDRVSVKATTTEGLGFVGSGDGLSAYAIINLEEA
jgi:2-C-methyl-D-erythritol 2,4-cyclodiphosphate synthase